MLLNTTECRLWKYSKDKDGYGLLKVNGKTTRAHRECYRAAFGEIPKGLLILHKCNNPSCTNPEHLYAGTQKQNMEDRALAGNGFGWKGPNQIGIKNTNVKLTEDQVKDILNNKKYGMSKILAKKYNTSPAYIRRIWQRQTWTHI